MLMNKKIIDAINKEIKAQEQLVKLLEKQASEYGIDNSASIAETRKSIEYMSNCVNKC